jgi:16S rRNA (guanine966-N2)-methyltransferase
MRVIAGLHKGRRLTAPTWDGLRPTGDRLKETLFNVLGDRLRGAHVIDGFAGSGAIGIEALSRGAAEVTFIDQDRRATELVARNLAHCGISSGYVIIRGSFAAALRQLAPGRRADLILLDPPYAMDDLNDILRAAADRLAPGGLVVLEHARRRVVPEQEAGLIRYRTLTAGSSALALYQPAGDPTRTPVEER